MTTRVNREHILQVALVRFVREAVISQHLFMAFDRSKPTGQFSHMREKARGVKAGTPDTLLIVAGFQPIWCELKAPGGKPTEHQLSMGDTLMSLGHWWSWVSGISPYHAWIASIGVECVPNAETMAQMADAGIASKVAKAEARAGKLPRTYKQKDDKPTSARIRKLNAARERVMF